MGGPNAGGGGKGDKSGKGKGKDKGKGKGKDRDGKGKGKDRDGGKGGKGDKSGGKGKGGKEKREPEAPADPYAAFLHAQHAALQLWNEHLQMKRVTLQKVSMSGESQDMVSDLLHELAGTDAEGMLYDDSEVHRMAHPL